MKQNWLSRSKGLVSESLNFDKVSYLSIAMVNNSSVSFKGWSVRSKSSYLVSIKDMKDHESGREKKMSRRVFCGTFMCNFLYFLLVLSTVTIVSLLLCLFWFCLHHMSHIYQFGTFCLDFLYVLTNWLQFRIVISLFSHCSSSKDAGHLGRSHFDIAHIHFY